MTAEAAARGRRNRTHGHTTELMVVKYLREQGWPDTCTTRAKLGHAGTHTPGDISWHTLVVLETWPDLRVCGSVRAQNNSGPGAIGVAPDRGQHPGRGAVMQDVTCACGCGGNPVSGRYLKGHNAKLRGRREVDHGTRADLRRQPIR